MKAIGGHRGGRKSADPIRKRNLSLRAQVGVPLIIIALFYLSACLSPLRVVQGARVCIAICLGLALLAFGIVLVQGSCRELFVKRHELWERWRLALITAALIALIHGALTVSSPLYWDTSAYFWSLDNACKEFTLTPLSFLAQFRLCGHVTYGYALFAGFGRYLTPLSPVGVNLVNLVLLCVTCALATDVINTQLPKAGKTAAVLGGLVIGCEPLMLGTTGSINLDMPLALFTLLMFCAYCHGWHALCGFLALIVCTTKETGYVFVVGFLLMLILVRLWRRDSLFERPGNTQILWVLAGLLVGIVCLVLPRLLLQTSLWGASYAPNGGFELGASYILLKLTTTFVFNGAWVPTFIVIACSIILGHSLRNGSRTAQTTRNFRSALLVYAGGIVVFTVASCFYLTINNPRYMEPTTIALTLAMVLLLCATVTAKKLLSCAIAVLLALGVAESAVLLDPITRAVFPTIKTGETETAYLSNWTAVKDDIFPDMLNYNLSCRYYGIALDRMLDQLGYDGSQKLVVWANGFNANVFYSLSGGVEETSSLGLRWDANAKTRVLQENTGATPIAWLDAKDFAQSEELPQTAYIICSPEFETRAPKEDSAEYQFVDANYDWGEKHWVDANGMGGIWYWEIHKKANA